MEKKENTRNRANTNLETKDVSALISRLRAYLNLSQAAFAKPLGISPTHIARFEKGAAIPSDDYIQMICDSYNVDKRYFGNDGLSGKLSVEKAVFVSSPKMEVSERLKSAREEKGWSQNELSKRSGVNRSIINRVEYGAKLTEKQGRRLAETLEVGFEWLMYGEKGKKLYPADQRMIEWLWENEDVRQLIWDRMKNC